MKHLHWLVSQAVLPSKISTCTSPYELLFTRKPHLGRIRLSGWRCWCTHRNPVKKLEVCSYEATMIEYAKGARGYKLWNPLSEKMAVSGDVTFDENNEFERPRLNQNSNKITFDPPNPEPGLDILWK